MNKYELYSKENERIRQCFSNHYPDILSFNKGTIIKIRWKKTGTWNMAVIYIIDLHLGTLCVFGDFGEAIYQWKGSISLNFLGDCNLDYFNGKCQASSCGERGKTWNQEIAVEYIKSYVYDSEKKSKLIDLVPESIAACESEFEWHRWLYDNGQEFFGNDYGEYGNIGGTISSRVQSHLIGLKMILEGLDSGKFSMPSSSCPWKRFKVFCGGLFSRKSNKYSHKS